MEIAAIANVIATQNVTITPIKVKASGGSGSYTYSIASDPSTGSGLSIDSSSGRITGTPTASRDFTITVTVRDGAGSRDVPTQVRRSFTMRVRPRVTVSAIGNITVTQSTSITPIQVSASGGRHTLMPCPATLPQALVCPSTRAVGKSQARQHREALSHLP